MKKSFKKLLTLPMLFVIASCGSNDYALSPSDYRGGYYYEDNNKTPGEDTNTYEKIVENKFVDTSVREKSYFTMCSSTMAYTNIKSLIEDQDKIPSSDAVKIEQMLNYFKYNYQLEPDQSLGVFNEVSDCPWNADHKLASIAIKAKDIVEEDKPMNLVFLIDRSGSMSDDISLMKQAFGLLINNLKETDKISIVTYATDVRVVTNGTTGEYKELITQAVNSISAGGATNGAGGIQKAYEVAQENFIEGGNNRVILATDGDFNVGISNSTELEEFISGKRDTGIYLSILGFGRDNFHDTTAETLAKKGDGNMFYIDNLTEAKKLFEEGLSSAFEVVAKDAKIEVAFDKQQVASYRLLGFENDQITEEQYNDNESDGGEILSGDVTVAMYEIILKNACDMSKSLFKTEVSFKDPDTKENKKVSADAAVYKTVMTPNFIFQAMVVEYGLLLRKSAYKGSASYDHVLAMYRENKADFELDKDKANFYELVVKTKQLASNN